MGLQAMTDFMKPEVRSQVMSRIRSKNTRQEVWLRKGLFAEGFRYRLHRTDLPGKPDIVLPRYGAAIFVHGCFWHGHDCHLFRMPASRTEFWRAKIEANRERDDRNIRELRERGWRVLVVWECAGRGRHRFEPRLLVTKISLWIWYGSEYANISSFGGPG